MKNVLVLVLTLTMVFGELSINYFQASAKRLIDERAQTLLQQARAAIGGEDAINAVNNLVSSGKITRKLKTPDNQERTLEGSLEMALETSGKTHKKVKLTFQGDPNAALSSSGETKKIFVENEKTILVRRSADASTVPGEEFHVTNGDEHGQKITVKTRERGAENEQNEFAQLMLGLLLKSSPSLNLVYNYAGEENVDGTLAEIIEATGGNNFKTRLYLDKQTHLPLMISYHGFNPHPVFMIHTGGGVPFDGQRSQNVIIFKTPDSEKSVENSGETKIFARRINSDENPDDAVAGVTSPQKITEEGEIQIRFSDFRLVGNLMLPHKLTSYFNDQLDETTTIDSYEINAANLLERFRDEPKLTKVQ